MAGERASEGVAAGAATGAGVPGLLGLLLAMEAGVPIPVPSDLVMLLLGERVSAGALPLWLAAAALELVALAGTAALFLAARGPGQALLFRFGPRLGLTGPRLDRIRSRLGLTGPGPDPTHPEARATHPVPRRVPRWGSVAHRVGRVRPAAHRVVPGLVVGRTTPGLRTVTVVAAASSGIRVGRALPALVVGSSVFLQAHLLLGYALGPAAREVLERARLPLLVAAAVALAAVVVLLLRGRRGRATRVLAEGACPVCLAAGLLPRRRRPAGTGRRTTPAMMERPAEVRPGAPVSGGRRYTSRLASLGLSERPRPDLSGQSRPVSPGDCWTCSTAGEPPLEPGDLPELLNALVANSTTASPASTVATRMARQGRHPVRAVVTGSSGKRASFSRRP